MKKKKAVALLVSMHPLQRVLVSLGFTLAVFLVCLIKELDIHPLLLSALLWNAFAISYIITGWIVFYNRTTDQIRTWARVDDGRNSKCIP